MTDQIKTPPAAAPANAAEDALVGTTVGRFTILNRLGAGGMGQVYSAEDTTLKRHVAIKRVAAQGKSAQTDRKRLLKEAQRASALNHPNIGCVYDVLEYGGELWVVMEFIEGETLRRRLARPISREEFFSIATQCCEGLQAAHEKGIIHGDIKPENIMLTAGNRVKVLDFGVARRMWRDATPEEATQSMQTMTASGGTPAYMAPEVLLRRPDDGRSDIFSLGLVFYEMLGGAQPFQSDSLATTVARIVHEEPPTLKNVPGPLNGLLTRAMAKNPEARYPTAGALLEDLRRVEAGGKPKNAPALAGKFHQYRAVAAVVIVVVALAALFSYRSLRHAISSSSATGTAQSSGLPQTEILAVLPFSAPANADPKIAALGEGLVENLAAKLGNLSHDRAFEVIPPRSLQEKNISKLADAAHTFGANLALATTLEPNGDLIKVSYSVQSVGGNSPLASDSISVPASDVFSVEGNVADGTVKALHLQLRPEEEAALKVHGTDHPDAYRYYLQARGYLLGHTKAENLDNAALMAREALKIDPNFGMAKAVLGMSDWLKYSDTKDKKWIDPARTECDDAIKLGNAGAAGHLCLGRINDGTGQYDAAISEYQAALSLEPANDEAATRLALAYDHAGKISEAEKAYQQAVQAHPNSRIVYNSFGAFYQARHEYDKALQMYSKVVQIAPDWYVTYVNMGSIYAEMAQYDKAIEASKKSIAIRPTYAAYVNLGAAYFGLGQFADAATAFEEAAKLDPQQYVTWGNLGEAYYRAGQKDQAIVPYRKAVELASESLKVNPHDPEVLSNLAGYYSVLGDRKSALLYLNQALQDSHDNKDVLADAAEVYNQLGETGLALEFLAKMMQAGYTPEKIRSMHEFDNLARTPGYQQLIRASHP
jgi:tetratricopeptide (TPR) repeat protein/predicted Ser/Thr protein kinase